MPGCVLHHVPHPALTSVEPETRRTAPAAGAPAPDGAAPYAPPSWFDQGGAAGRAVHPGARVLDPAAMAQVGVSGTGGGGLLDQLGEGGRKVLDPPVAYIVSDEGVRGQARRAQRAMEAVSIPTHMFLIPPGEQNKTLAMAEHMYTWLAGHKAERGHLIIAVGGGVVGDLAGFVAATYLRGMPLAQVPTSLLAMMDAAVGGKTAVD